MIDIVIVEDNNDSYEGFKQAIDNYFPEIRILNRFSDVETAFSNLKKIKFDWLVLDIDLDGNLNGFDLLDLIGINQKYKVIFYTGHDELAIKAIRYNAYDYFTKPIAITDIKKCISRYLKEINNPTNDEIMDDFKNKNDYLILNTHEKTAFVKHSEILFIKSEGAYSNIYYNDTFIKYSKNLNSLSKLLDQETFIRVNRFFIINKFHVKEIIKTNNSEGILILSNNHRIPLSSNLKNELNNLLSLKL